jgi:hypothetical protein
MLPKLVVPGTIKCSRTRENVLFKMGKLLLMWICDQEFKGDDEFHFDKAEC